MRTKKQDIVNSCILKIHTSQYQFPGRHTKAGGKISANTSLGPGLFQGLCAHDFLTFSQPGDKHAIIIILFLQMEKLGHR